MYTYMKFYWTRTFTFLEQILTKYAVKIVNKVNCRSARLQKFAQGLSEHFISSRNYRKLF